MSSVIMGKYRQLTNKELRESGHQSRIGYTFEKNTTFGKQIIWEGKCPICGEWISHDFGKDREQFIRDGRWDFKRKRLTHCAKNKLCTDWYYEYLRCCKEKNEILFRDLKRKGLIA